MYLSKGFALALNISTLRRIKMKTMYWEKESLFLLDQTQLPLKIEYIQCENYIEVVNAIKILAVRGAPAIGVAAAYGLALGAKSLLEESMESFLLQIKQISNELDQSRPTAVNLHWALNRMLNKVKSSLPATPKEIYQIILEEAHLIYQEDLKSNQAMGSYGASLIPHKARILTHCNAGALATAGFGTALGVIRAAQKEGKDVLVYADETRPLLQGARLTAFELSQDNIPVTLITDNMAASLMAHKMVDLIIVGADRIAANGDAANKIGTYGLAVLAKRHNLPFYIVAPVSTIDLNLASGEKIPIEERNPEEVTHFGKERIAPLGIKVWNPAFDVTPAELITAIITEKGIIKPSYLTNILAVVHKI